MRKVITICSMLSLLFLAAGCDNGTNGSGMADDGGAAHGLAYPGWFETGVYILTEDEDIRLIISETDLEIVSGNVGSLFSIDFSGYAVLENNYEDEEFFDDDEVYFCLTNGESELYFYKSERNPEELGFWIEKHGDMEEEDGGTFISEENFNRVFAYPDWIHVARYEGKVNNSKATNQNGSIRFSEKLVRFQFNLDGGGYTYIERKPYEVTVRNYCGRPGIEGMEIVDNSSGKVFLRIYRNTDTYGSWTPDDSDPNRITVDDNIGLYQMTVNK